ICPFLFQAVGGIRAFHVTGVQTCALPIWPLEVCPGRMPAIGDDGADLRTRPSSSGPRTVRGRHSRRRPSCPWSPPSGTPRNGAAGSLGGLFGLLARGHLCVAVGAGGDGDPAHHEAELTLRAGDPWQHGRRLGLRLFGGHTPGGRVSAHLLILGRGTPDDVHGTTDGAGESTCSRDFELRAPCPATDPHSCTPP